MSANVAACDGANEAASGAVPVFIINLCRDTARLAQLHDQLHARLSGPSAAAVTRIEGAYGHAIPDAVCLMLTRDPNSVNAKGAVGCFLSHVRTWEAILAADVPFAIVLEDDVRLLDWSDLQALALPAEFDLVFCNDRTEIIPPDGAAPARPGQRSYHPIASALAAIEARHMAVGGDCYILSRAGAAKLIDCVTRDLYFSHVDLRLLAYALDPATLSAALSAGFIFESISELHRIAPRFNAISAYSMSPPLAEHIIGESSRDREDRLGRPQ